MKIIKTYNGVVKSINEEKHTAVVTISTKATDRDGEIILPEAFKKHRKTYEGHPVLLSSHNYYNLLNQIGEAHKTRVTEDGVESEFEWYVGKGNPEADWGWFLATKGIAAFSIGFMAHSYEPGEIDAKTGSYKNGVRRTYTEIEHLETSQVLIPSNRGAVQSRRGIGEESELCELAMKSFKEEEWTEIEKTYQIGMANQKASFITVKELDEKLKALKEELSKASVPTLQNFVQSEAFLKSLDSIIEEQMSVKECQKVLFGDGGQKDLKPDLNESDIDDLAAAINKEFKQTTNEMKEKGK